MKLPESHNHILNGIKSSILTGETQGVAVWIVHGFRKEEAESMLQKYGDIVKSFGGTERNGVWHGTMGEYLWSLTLKLL